MITNYETHEEAGICNLQSGKRKTVSRTSPKVDADVGIRIKKGVYNNYAVDSRGSSQQVKNYVKRW